MTGTSVLAIKYKDGVMLAADNLGAFYSISLAYSSADLTAFSTSPASYGSLARFKDIPRLQPVGSTTVVGAGGDMSDFQYLQRLLDELVIDEFTAQDGNELGPKEIHEYLSQVMYARRSKMNPLWNSLLVGGFKDGQRCVSYLVLHYWPCIAGWSLSRRLNSTARFVRNESSG